MKKIKILVTGGGTGGHVIPLMSIVDELKKYNTQILYVGSGNKIEKQEANKHHISYKSIMVGKYRRYFDWQNFIDFFKFLIGIFQSFFIVLCYNPDRVFSKGGYVGLPIIYAAWLLRKKIFIHETDAKLGLANKLSLNKCQKIFVSFSPKFYPEISADKIVYSGSPLKEDFHNLKKNNYFNNKLKTILITGGSQGSCFLNQTIAQIIPELIKKYNIIHIAGEKDYQRLKKNNWENYKVYNYTSEFANFLYNSDLVISRSGGTIFEIAFCKKPAILIPLPGSANNHQERNAQILHQSNAALVLKQAKITPDSLLEIISRLVEDKILLKELGLKIGDFFQENASKTIAQYLISD